MCSTVGSICVQQYWQQSSKVWQIYSSKCSLLTDSEGRKLLFRLLQGYKGHFRVSGQAKLNLMAHLIANEVYYFTINISVRIANEKLNFVQKGLSDDGGRPFA